MSRSMLIAAVCAATVVAIAAPAGARYPARVRHYDNDFHYRAAKIHLGGRHQLGHWRPGPARGVAFGFSTYRGDPFGGDDYYDGHRCYYVHHQNYCMRNHIFNGFD